MPFGWCQKVAVSHGPLEPHVEGTTQQQMDQHSLEHAFSLGHKRFIKCHVKMVAQVCGSVQESRVDRLQHVNAAKYGK